MPAIYLTKEERRLYNALPDGVKEGCRALEEAGDAYETNEQLQARVRILAYESDPELRGLMRECAEKVYKGEEVDAKVIMEKTPENVMPILLFTLGARGVGLMIKYALQEVSDAEGLLGIADLTYIRHLLFKTNESVPAASHA